jgi:hypothetical protein
MSYALLVASCSEQKDELRRGTRGRQSHRHVDRSRNRAKEERELKKKLASIKTLGDSSDEEGDKDKDKGGGAKDWVAKSRAVEVQKKERAKLEAELKRRQFEAQDDEAEVRGWKQTPCTMQPAPCTCTAPHAPLPPHHSEVRGWKQTPCTLHHALHRTLLSHHTTAPPPRSAHQPGDGARVQAVRGGARTR